MSDDQGDQTEAELERTRKVVAEAMAEQVATNTEALGDVSPEAETVEAVERPKGNAGRDEWVAYATSQGYEVDDTWNRDDIRGLFAEEG